jgi:hypothetical protein
MAKKAAAQPVSVRPQPKAQSTAQAATTLAPSHEAIAARAFELYLQRGGGDGSEMNDWLRAEAELRTRN